MRSTVKTSTAPITIMGIMLAGIFFSMPSSTVALSPKWPTTASLQLYISAMRVGLNSKSVYLPLCFTAAGARPPVTSLSTVLKLSASETSSSIT